MDTRSPNLVRYIEVLLYFLSLDPGMRQTFEPMHNDVKAVPALGQIKVIWGEKGEVEKVAAESLDLAAFWKSGL